MAGCEARQSFTPTLAQLHIGINADRHEVVVAELTPDDVGDVSTVPDLLEQIGGKVSSLTADGAYDGEIV